MAGDSVEVRLEISIFWPTAGYDPFEGIVMLASEVQQVFRFRQHMDLINICFHVHRLDDVETLSGLAVIAHSKGTVEGREGVEPGVTKQVQVPQVLMGIYDLHIFRRRDGESIRNEKA